MRILVAKPGLDGHDRGAKVLCRVLRDWGHDVVYTGLHQRPPAIAAAAIEEDVDVVALSILSGSHLELTLKTVEALKERRAHDIPVIVGGVIPPDDESALRDVGAAAIFGITSSLDDLHCYLLKLVGELSCGASPASACNPTGEAAVAAGTDVRD
jgi:methylmalonyl-CoA mutase, C-terminal domain